MHAVHVLDDPSELPQRARWYLSQWGSRFRTPLSAAKIRGAVGVTADLGMPDPGPVPEQLLAHMIAFEQRYGGLASRLPPSGDFAEFGLDTTGNLEAWRDAAGGWVGDCGCDHRGVVWVLDEDGLVQTRGALGLQGDLGTMPAHLELLALQVVYVMNPQWTRVWVGEPPDDTVLDRLGSWPDAPAAVLERLGALPPASAIELPGSTTWWADEQVAACWYPLRERAVLYGRGQAGVRRIEQAIKGAGS